MNTLGGVFDSHKFCSLPKFSIFLRIQVKRNHFSTLNLHCIYEYLALPGTIHMNDMVYIFRMKDNQLYQAYNPFFYQDPNNSHLAILEPWNFIFRTKYVIPKSSKFTVAGWWFQIGSFPREGMKIKNVWNHHPVSHWPSKNSLNDLWIHYEITSLSCPKTNRNEHHLHVLARPAKALRGSPG